MVTRSSSAEILHINQAAELLGTTEKALRRRIERGLLPHRRWGGRVVLLRSELLDFVNTLPGVTVEAARVNLAARNGGRYV